MRAAVVLVFCLTMLRRASSFRGASVGLGLLYTAQQNQKHGGRAMATSAAAASSVSNPLLRKKDLPAFADIKPEHVVPAIETRLAELKADFAALEQSLSNPQQGESWGTRRLEYDYEGVVEKMEAIQDPLGFSWSVVGHLMGVANSDELRAAHDKMQPVVIETYQALGQSQPLYKALSALKQRQSVWSQLDEAQRRIITSSIRGMRNSGVGLPIEERERFNKLQLEAAELSSKFSNNVLDSTKLFKLRITDGSKLAGLPTSVLAMFAQKSVQEGDKDATAESGPWTVTLDMPSYLPCMQHLQDRELREQLYRAFVTRASTGDYDNAPLIKRTLQVKYEMAKILGYGSHAEKSLSSKMTPSVQAVEDLTAMLLAAAYPAAVKELELIKTLAKTKGFSGELQLWDVPFWSERLREDQYAYTEEELKPYFALPAVLDGLFKLCNRLFGVRIEAADGEAEVWDKDVRFFKIYDEQTKEHIASFFLDPYSRPATKRGGAWMDSCTGRSKVLNSKPVAYLTCNGAPPVGDAPSLLTWRECETLMHEAGHGLQHMLTRVVHGEAAGINNVEWDAVEQPSQFMENWMYDKKTLDSFAKHYQTGEPLPEALFKKVCDAKTFLSGLGMIRQLYFGAIDMHVHSQKFNPDTDSVFDVQHDLARLYTVIPPLKEDRFLCSFSHIFAGGYSAGYFSYKMAEVLSADG